MWKRNEAELLPENTSPLNTSHTINHDLRMHDPTTSLLGEGQAGSLPAFVPNSHTCITSHHIIPPVFDDQKKVLHCSGSMVSEGKSGVDLFLARRSGFFGLDHTVRSGQLLPYLLALGSAALRRRASGTRNTYILS